MKCWPFMTIAMKIIDKALEGKIIVTFVFLIVEILFCWNFVSVFACLAG